MTKTKEKPNYEKLYIEEQLKVKRLREIMKVVASEFNKIVREIK